MDAFVKGSFWTDDRIEELDVNTKLAILWLITNPARNLIGFTHTSSRRFQFETGLAVVSLQRACEALPDSFKALPDNWYFSAKFFRHQFGKGGRISLANNIVKSAVKVARGLPSPLQGVFLDAYPELKEQVLSVDLIGSPPQGERESTREREGGTEVSGEPSVDTTVLENIIAAYPRSENADTCLRIVAGHVGNGDEPADILKGTLEIAKVIEKLPGGARNAYLPSAPNFFKDRRWKDDPSTWARQSLKGGRTAEISESELRGQLGSRIENAQMEIIET